MHPWQLDSFYFTPAFFVLVILLGLFILLSIALYYTEKWKKRANENLGQVIESLENGKVYYQFPSPEGLVFLSREGEKNPRAYALDFDIKTLPTSFMFIQGEKGTGIVSWQLVDPYVFSEKNFNEEAEAIELMELAGKELD